MAKEAFQVDWI